VERALAAFPGRPGRAAGAADPAAEPQGGLFGAMPAAGEAGMGVELVTPYPGDAGRGLHTHLATVPPFDPGTGEPLAPMGSGLVTGMRTAARAVATRALSAPDAAVLAVPGTGVQARVHVEALRLARDFREAGSGAARLGAPRRARRGWAPRPRPRRRKRCGAPTWWSPPPRRPSRYCGAPGSLRGRR
jgi:hypothetical protein